MVCGRRFGKTVLAVTRIIMCSLTTKGEYWYIAPHLKQAKEIAWDIFKDILPNAVISKCNESDLSIRLFNGSIIRLKGAQDPDSLRGSGLSGVVMDEFADMKWTIWQAVIRPALSDKQGWAMFIGTPKGKMNHFYEMFIKDAEHEDDTYRNIDGDPILPDINHKSFKFKTEDNPYIPREEIKEARESLNDEYFRQEYEASFENYTGMVYKELKEEHFVGLGAFEEWHRPHFNYYIGIDTGRYDAASFIAIDTKGKAFIFDEVYMVDAISKDFGREINLKILYWSKLLKIKKNDWTIIIDSASQTKRELRACDIHAIDSEKDVLNSINNIRFSLKHDKLLIVKGNCPMHVTEYWGYTWAEKARGKNMMIYPKKEKDHLINADQYIFNSYFATEAEEPEKRKEDLTKLDLLDPEREVLEDALEARYMPLSSIVVTTTDDKRRRGVVSY